MNILISAATEKELGPFLNSRNDYTNIRTSSIVSGVGMVCSAFELARYCFNSKPDLILNIGLCGTFHKDWELTEVLNITEDAFSELGAEDDETFVDVFDLGLIDKNEEPFNHKKLQSFRPPQISSLSSLRKCSGITVNTVHGSDTSIKKIKSRWPADVESMEGASHFYVCQQLQIPCLQIRAISNYIEKRDRNNWKIDEALKNLWAYLDTMINDIDKTL